MAISKIEAEAALSGPATWSNKFVVSFGRAVRISFFEQNGEGEPLHFRNATAMSYQDAVDLKNVLATMLAEMERQIQAAQAASECTGFQTLNIGKA